MSAGRNVVAKVCTTQIDDESSRMIPSTVPAMPVTLARVAGERAPFPSDVIDALEDDLAPRRVEHVEGGQRDTPSLIPGDAGEEEMDVDPDVKCQSAVRWIDMTCGDEEEGGDVHQRKVEVEYDTIWMRGEERVVFPPCGVCRGDTQQVLSIARHAVGGFQTRGSCDDGVF